MCVRLNVSFMLTLLAEGVSSQLANPLIKQSNCVSYVERLLLIVVNMNYLKKCSNLCFVVEAMERHQAQLREQRRVGCDTWVI